MASSPGNPNFGTENNPGVVFSSDNQPLNNGRPAGVRNRSTVARKVLEMTAVMPDATFDKIKSVFPDVEKTMSVEEVATIVMIGNAIGKGDVNAYKSVMDSAYGAPKQEVAMKGNLDLNKKVTFK
jgi:hypothetical protein